MRALALLLALGLVVEGTVIPSVKIFTEPTSVFTSPDFPHQYPNSANEPYLISVAQGNFIHVDLLMFQTENLYDTLTIYDGFDDTARKLGEFYGNLTGHMVESTGSSMFLVFQTDLTGQRDGFIVRYTSVTINKSIGVEYRCPDFVIPPILPYGLVTSPGYPFNYPDNTSCTYELKGYSGQRVIATFYSFITELCYDTVHVKDGYPNKSAKDADELCGPLLAGDNEVATTFSVISATEELSLWFSSDLTRNYSGFSVVYRYVTAEEATRILRMNGHGAFPYINKEAEEKKVGGSSREQRQAAFLERVSRYRPVSPLHNENVAVLPHSGAVFIRGPLLRPDRHRP